MPTENSRILLRPVVPVVWDTQNLGLENVQRAAQVIRGSRLAVRLKNPLSRPTRMGPIEEREMEEDLSELRDGGLIDALSPELTRLGRRVSFAL